MRIRRRKSKTTTTKKPIKWHSLTLTHARKSTTTAKKKTNCARQQPWQKLRLKRQRERQALCHTLSLFFYNTKQTIQQNKRENAIKQIYYKRIKKRITIVSAVLFERIKNIEKTKKRKDKEEITNTHTNIQ